MEYALPKAEFFPSFELDRTETPTRRQPARRQGRRRDRDDRLDAGGRERGRRRARAARDRARRHAAHPGARLAGDRAPRTRKEASCTRRLRPSSPTTGLRPSTRRSRCSPSTDDSRPLAGGHSLLPMMKLRLADAGRRSSTSRRIAGLGGIEAGRRRAARSARLRRTRPIASSALVQTTCPVLAEAAAMIGDRQVRNRGTIGGSLAHADPGADYPTVVTALGATIRRPAGRDAGDRRGDFFTGLFATALEPGELITAVGCPRRAGTGTRLRQAQPSGLGLRRRRRRRRRDDRGRRRHADEARVGGVSGSPTRSTSAGSLSGASRTARPSPPRRPALPDALTT